MMEPSGERRSKRPWFQFRLRTLLVVVLLANLAFSWFAVVYRRAAREAAAAKTWAARYAYDFEWTASGVPEPPGPDWLAKLLGCNLFAHVDYVEVRSEMCDEKMALLADMPHVTYADLDDVKGVTPDGFRYLSELRRLEILDLRESCITDAGLECLRPLSQLAILNLNKAPVVGHGLSNLEGLSNIVELQAIGPEDLKCFVDTAVFSEMAQLELLDISNRTIRLGGFDRLVTLKHLKDLYVNNCSLTDTLLDKIDRLSSLERLSVSFNKVSDQTLTKIGRLRNLKALWLGDTLVTDRGIKQLADLHDLEELSIAGTRVTGRGIEQLVELQHLRVLHLSGIDINDRIVDSLLKMPRLEAVTVADDDAAKLNRLWPILIQRTLRW